MFWTRFKPDISKNTKVNPEEGGNKFLQILVTTSISRGIITQKTTVSIFTVTGISTLRYNNFF
jgi:hypothetical protein